MGRNLQEARSRGLLEALIFNEHSVNDHINRSAWGRLGLHITFICFLHLKLNTVHIVYLKEWIIEFLRVEEIRYLGHSVISNMIDVGKIFWKWFDVWPSQCNSIGVFPNCRF